MSIISYFLTFVLVISLILLLVPYFRSFQRQREHQRPLSLGREEFAEEFFPDTHGKENDSVDYKWKGNLAVRTGKDELPDSYKQSNLMLLIKNPTCIYAYWDIPMNWEGDPVLRIYETGFFHGENGLKHLFDIEIFLEAKNWFIDVPKENCSYYAELGRRMPDGRFIPLLKSNIVKTPRASLSTAIDENWIPCDIYGHLKDVSYGLSSSYMHQEHERVDR